jgi:hypothetical protein
LRELLGRGDGSFTVQIQIAKNEHSVATRALIDTGANGFAFIDMDFELFVAKHFGWSMIRLETPCPVRGYDGRSGPPITHVLPVNLIVEGRIQLKLNILADRKAWKA